MRKYLILRSLATFARSAAMVAPCLVVAADRRARSAIVATARRRDGTRPLCPPFAFRIQYPAAAERAILLPLPAGTVTDRPVGINVKKQILLGGIMLGLHCIRSLPKKPITSGPEDGRTQPP